MGSQGPSQDRNFLAGKPEIFGLARQHLLCFVGDLWHLVAKDVLVLRQRSPMAGARAQPAVLAVHKCPRRLGCLTLLVHSLQYIRKEESSHSRPTAQGSRLIKKSAADLTLEGYNAGS